MLFTFAAGKLDRYVLLNIDIVSFRFPSSSFLVAGGSCTYHFCGDPSWKLQHSKNSPAPGHPNDPRTPRRLHLPWWIWWIGWPWKSWKSWNIRQKIPNIKHQTRLRSNKPSLLRSYMILLELHTFSGGSISAEQLVEVDPLTADPRAAGAWSAPCHQFDTSVHHESCSVQSLNLPCSNRGEAKERGENWTFTTSTTKRLKCCQVTFIGEIWTSNVALCHSNTTNVQFSSHAQMQVFQLLLLTSTWIALMIHQACSMINTFSICTLWDTFCFPVYINNFNQFPLRISKISL